MKKEEVFLEQVVEKMGPKSRKLSESSTFFGFAVCIDRTIPVEFDCDTKLFVIVIFDVTDTIETEIGDIVHVDFARLDIRCFYLMLLVAASAQYKRSQESCT
jgi:hypothetical protein